MTDQDREKKIAEIREAVEKEKPEAWQIGYIRFLLSERDELEHKLCELEEENRKLREERDEWGRTAQEAINTVFVREHQLQSAQQDKEKLIEGLRMATKLLGTVPMNDGRLRGAYNKLCDTLKAVGVEVDS